MSENEICGTKDPTFHRLLLDTRFELPLGQTFQLTAKPFLSWKDFPTDLIFLVFLN